MLAGMLIPAGTSPTIRAEGPRKEPTEIGAGAPLGLKIEAAEISNPKCNRSEIFFCTCLLVEACSFFVAKMFLHLKIFERFFSSFFFFSRTA